MWYSLEGKARQASATPRTCVERTMVAVKDLATAPTALLYARVGTLPYC